MKTQTQRIIIATETLTRETEGIVKYIGMLRLIRAIFRNKAHTTLEEAVEQAMSHLSERERKVLETRFGFNGRAMTLEEAGRTFGVTRERIRQLEAKAIRKLANPIYKRVLFGDTWQGAVQALKEEGDKLLVEHQKQTILRNQIRRGDAVATGKPLEELNLPTRVYNALRWAKFDNVTQVSAATDRELGFVRNLGRKSVQLIRERIKTL